MRTTTTLIILLLAALLVGCSAQAYSERYEEQVLTSLQDSTWQNNPEFMVRKCYRLSQEAKNQCYENYVTAMVANNKEPDARVCERLSTC